MSLWYILAVLALPALLGGAIRRWSLLPVLIFFWLLILAAFAIAGELEGDSDGWSPVELALWATALVCLPAEIAATVGILVGRLVRGPPRPARIRAAEDGVGALQ